MITREQVSDLRPGDVVELKGYPSLKDAAVTGPLWADGETKKLCVGPFVIRHRDGDPPSQYDDDPEFTLTVVARAPRPLYVNHPRTVPVAGDVAVCADGSEPVAHTYHHLGDEGQTRWWRFDDALHTPPRVMRLLIDGETGQVVQ